MLGLLGGEAAEDGPRCQRFDIDKGDLSVTVRIDRHDLPFGPEAEHYAERLHQYFTGRIEKPDGPTSSIDRIFSTSVLNLRTRRLIGPRAAAVETWEAA
ncbi:hypothetical protein [Streptomyces alfalfae]